MATAWDTWLRKLVTDGKGGLGLQGRPQIRAVDRGLEYEYILAVAMDMSADEFEATIKAGPDAVSALATFAVTVGIYTEGVTPITLGLSAEETAALPVDVDADGIEEMVFDILWTPYGGTQERLMAGIIQVSGKVT